MTMMSKKPIRYDVHIIRDLHLPSGSSPPPPLPPYTTTMTIDDASSPGPPRNHSPLPPSQRVLDKLLVCLNCESQMHRHRRAIRNNTVAFNLQQSLQYNMQAVFRASQLLEQRTVLDTAFKLRILAEHFVTMILRKKDTHPILNNPKYFVDMLFH